jgi:hypothetical protein
MRWNFFLYQKIVIMCSAGVVTASRNGSYGIAVDLSLFPA